MNTRVSDNSSSDRVLERFEKDWDAFSNGRSRFTPTDKAIAKFWYGQGFLDAISNSKVRT